MKFVILFLASMSTVVAAECATATVEVDPTDFGSSTSLIVTGGYTGKIVVTVDQDVTVAKLTWSGHKK